MRRGRKVKRQAFIVNSNRWTSNCHMLAYFERKVKLSAFSAYTDGSPPKLMISGVLLHFTERRWAESQERSLQYVMHHWDERNALIRNFTHMWPFIAYNVQRRTEMWAKYSSKRHKPSLSFDGTLKNNKNPRVIRGFKITQRWEHVYLNINQLDVLNFIMSLFHASTCFEHMCSKHVEAWNKLIIKFSTSSWLILT